MNRPDVNGRHRDRWEFIAVGSMGPKARGPRGPGPRAPPRSQLPSIDVGPVQQHIHDQRLNL